MIQRRAALIATGRRSHDLGMAATRIGADGLAHQRRAAAIQSAGVGSRRCRTTSRGKGLFFGWPLPSISTTR